MKDRVRRLAPPGEPQPHRAGDFTAVAPEPLLYSLERVAMVCGVSTDTVKYWITNGIMLAVPVGVSGTRMKVPAVELEKWRGGQHGQGTGIRPSGTHEG